VHLASRLGEALGRSLSPTLFFECLTVDELVAHPATQAPRVSAPTSASSLEEIVGRLADGGLSVDDAIILLESDLPGSDPLETDCDV
jgi:polyketide synthase PksJ